MAAVSQIREGVRRGKHGIICLIAIAALLSGIFILNGRMAGASCNSCGTPVWADAKVRVPGGEWQDSITICMCQEVEYSASGRDIDLVEPYCDPVNDTGRVWWERLPSEDGLCTPGVYAATLKVNDVGTVCDESIASDTATIIVLDCCPP